MKVMYRTLLLPGIPASKVAAEGFPEMKIMPESPLTALGAYPLYVYFI